MRNLNYTLVINYSAEFPIISCWWSVNLIRWNISRRGVNLPHETFFQCYNDAGHWSASEHTHTHTLNRWTYVCVGCGCWSVWPKTVFTAVWIIHKRRQFRCCVSVVCRGEQLSRQRSTRLFRLSHRIPHPTAAALLMSAPSSFYSPFKLKEIRRNSLAQWTKIWINFQL